MSPISRRQFVVGSTATVAVAGGGAAAWAATASSGRPGDRSSRPDQPPQPTNQSAQPAQPKSSTKQGTLVLITLYGGNDGLNTLIPYTDSAYLSGRPTLGYQPDQVLDLADGMGLNPKLTNLHTLWQQGHLAVVRGVGYPNPSLSHFQSMDIWQTANPTDGSGAGWVGRWLDQAGDDPMRAISVGATLPLILRGEQQSATAVLAPTIDLAGGPAVQAAYQAMSQPVATASPLAGAVSGSVRDLFAAQAQLDALHPAPSTAAITDLGGQLQVVASLIQAGAPTQVYEVSLSSFDFHADEKANQERLLADLDTSVGTFLQSIAGHPAGAATVVMTYSEFGRRPAENASGGTDHGAASMLFVAGNSVKGGTFYGEQPSLTQLDSDGNPVFNVDFRSVFATVLERVVGTDSTSVLGGRYPTLDFV